MPNLTVKGVPDHLHTGLKRTASEEGMSLNAYILQALRRDQSDAARRRRMRERWPELQRFVASLPFSTVDSVDLLRESRDGG